MSKKKGGIYDALPIVAAAYAERFGVQVNIVNSGTACTDSEGIIWLPYLKNVDENIYWGYLAHEAGHIKYTQTSAIKLLKTDFQFSLLNALEDCRIERLMADRYPGTVYTLTALDEYLIAKGDYGFDEQTNPATEVIFTCLFWGMYNFVGKEVFKPLLDDGINRLNQSLGVKFSTELTTLLKDHLPAAMGTHAVLQLVHQICDLLKEYSSESSNEEDLANDSSREDNSQQQSSGNNPSSDESADDTSDDVDSDLEQPNNDGSDRSEMDSKSGQEGAKSNANSDALGQAGEDNLNQFRSSIVESILSANQDELPKDRSETIAKDLSTSSSFSTDKAVCYGAALDPITNASAGELIEDQASKVSSRLHHSLYGLVQSRANVAARTKRTGKHIDSSKMLRLMSGDTRVFKSKAQVISPNTAIHLLVDASSSMQGTRIEVARYASYAIAKALDSIKGVNPGVSFFGDFSDDSKIVAVQKHGQKVIAKRSGFFVRPSGGTPMPEGILYAASQLIKQKEDRKIIVCLTDGEPNDTDATLKYIRDCEASGIEVLGVGIQTNSTKNIFSNQVVINRLEDLPSKLFDLIGEKVLHSVAA